MKLSIRNKRELSKTSLITKRSQIGDFPNNKF